MGAPPITPPGGGVAPPAVEYISETFSPLVKFLLQGVQPPSRVYIRREDVVTINWFSGFGTGSFTVSGRLLLAHGEVIPFQQSFTPTPSRNGQLFRISLAEGFLLSLGIQSGGALIGGAPSFCQVFLGRTEQAQVGVFELLVSGYVGASRALTYPQFPAARANDGSGLIRNIGGTQPAAGLEISEAVPTGARWVFRCITFTLVTSAVAGNRLVTLLIDDGASIFSRVEQINVQPPSTTKNYTYGQGYAFLTGQINTFTGPLPFQLSMGQAFRIRTSTQNLDVGDAYNRPIYEVEEWIEDQ